MSVSLEGDPQSVNRRRPRLEIGVEQTMKEMLSALRAAGWSQFLFNLLFMPALLPIVERFYGSWAWALCFVTGLVGQLANCAWLRGGGGTVLPIP